MTISDSRTPPIIHLSEIDSTSNYLKNRSTGKPVEEFTTVYADFQTAGKGQRGNHWESEKGQNLLFSMIMYPDFLEIRKQFQLSQAIALAVKEELDTYSEDFSIKWPNDIYWNNRKICGTLIENDLMGSTIKNSIAGIGINVNQTHFRSEAPDPVSLTQITGETYSIPALLNRIIRRIMTYYSLLKEGHGEEIAHRYHNALFRRDGFHSYCDDSGEFMARIVMVKAEGTLILEDQAGKRRAYAFKEVRYIL